MSEKIIYKNVSDKFNVTYKKQTHKNIMSPHTHNAIEIYLSLSDVSNVLTGSVSTSIKKNTLLIFPPYCIHSLASDMENIYERFVININTVWFEHLLDGVNDSSYSYMHSGSAPIIIELEQNTVNSLVKILKKAIACKESRTFATISAFFEVLDFIDSLVANGENTSFSTRHISRTQKTVNAMIEYIDEHLFENIKIKDIADAFFLSPNYAAKIFKKHTFSPINNYITLQRITVARQMLRDGRSVSETQLATGYASYEHFFRTFKKIMNVTPKEYRDYHYLHKDLPDKTI